MMAFYAVYPLVGEPPQNLLGLNSQPGDNGFVMSSLDTTREFLPGTTGWTADDLDDPQIERLWEAGAYEIVEGVLTLMPPAYFDGSAALFSLMEIISQHVRKHGPQGRFGNEADLVVG